MHVGLRPRAAVIGGHGLTKHRLAGLGVAPFGHFFKESTAAITAGRLLHLKLHTLGDSTPGIGSDGTDGVNEDLNLLIGGIAPVLTDNNGKAKLLGKRPPVTDGK